MSVAATWTRENIAYAAGLFDGEGCITEVQCSMRLTVASTDRDILERFQSAVGCGKISERRNTGPLTRKVQYVWFVTSFEKCQALLAAMWPWLCERRKRRAAEMLGKHKIRPVAPTMRRKSALCPRGHRLEGENVYAHPKGTKICKTCRGAYMKTYYREGKEAALRVVNNV